MKYLVLIVVLVVLVGLLRAGRRPRRAPAPPPATPPLAGPQPMVRCAHCGLHLPLADAVGARQLHYCSLEHQQADSQR